MLKIILILVPFFFVTPASAAQSLSALLELQAKESANNRKICETELKALPEMDELTAAEITKALKAVPPFPKETAGMLETLSNASLPTDKIDLQKSAEMLDKAPICWDANSIALQGKGAALIIDKGTKRQREDFTAAYVVRVRAENKKQQLILPLVVELDTLDQLAKAELLNASVKDEIHQAHARAQELAKMLSDKYPNAADERDNKQILEIRSSELSSCRQVQALIDSILKKI